MKISTSRTSLEKASTSRGFDAVRICRADEAWAAAFAAATRSASTPCLNNSGGAAIASALCDA